MSINITSKKYGKETKISVLVVFASHKKKGSEETLRMSGLDKGISATIKDVFAEKAFMAQKNETIIFRNYNQQGIKHLVCVGLGETAGINFESLRQAASSASKFLRTNNFTKACVLLDSAQILTKKGASLEQSICEGFLLQSYTFDDYKGTEKKKDNPLDITLVYKSGSRASIEKSISTAFTLCESVNFSRWLADTPPCVMTPERLAKETQKAVRGTKIKVTVWDKERIKKEKMGGLHGVSLGSHNSPRFIIMEYRGAAASKKPLCFVGKAITFDSGGLNIKVGNHMSEMKYDMCGGANVIGAVLAIAKLKLRVNILALIPSAENAVGPMATRPGDILTARNGKTVEVLNTDAEGRLILMDALSYATEKNPAAICDAATLTGAILVSLSNVYTGVFSRNKKLVKKIQLAANQTGELVWSMPICDYFVSDMKSVYAAQLRNISKNKGGGSSTAAAFLEQFVGEDIPWAHFDIAGTAWDASNRLNYYPGGGATGCMVRTFVELAKNF